MTTPDWLTVGADVAVFSHGMHSAGVVTPRRVKSIGKAFVTLDNGVRYSLRGLLKHSPHQFGATEYVKAMDDPDVLRAIAQRERDRAAYNEGEALKAWRKSGDDVELRAIIERLSAFLP